MKKKIRVLIGDYIELALENDKKILEQLDFEVVTANSAIDMIEKIKMGEKYDIVITNRLYKDGSTGRDLLNELRDNIDYKIIIILLSLTKEDESIFYRQFDAVIQKPLTLQNILPVLKKYKICCSEDVM